MTNALIQEGFNLLPHRSRRRREIRRQRIAVFAAASLAGFAAVGAVTGWDAFERIRLDERRGALETSMKASHAQTEDYARLMREQAERRRARDDAQPLAAPRDRFLTMLEALSDAPLPQGVVLQRVTQRAGEVELAALAPESQTAAAWLKRLEHLSGVQSVEVVEMKRRVEAVAGKRRAETAAAGHFEFTALVRYERHDAPANATKVSGKSGRHMNAANSSEGNAQ